MKKYYAERKGLIKGNLQMDLYEVLSFFYQTYVYFSNKGYFKSAVSGVWKGYAENERQILPPTLAPTAEVFFATKLQSKKVYPIYEHYESYQEETLFTVIEIMYDHIAYYDYENDELVKDEPKREFCEQINNILKLYKNGYYLEPQNGFIMELPNEALKEQLTYDGNDMEESVYAQLRTASEMYYRFDSNEEMKKKAINILADILENVREDVKNVLNSEYQINKNEHDKLIFDIVNGYNIRHNNAKQKTDYSKQIWYDWMMQYYTSTIITYYRLKKEHEFVF